MSFNAKDGAKIGAATAAAAVAAGIGTYVVSKWIEAGANKIAKAFKEKKEEKEDDSE